MPFVADFGSHRLLITTNLQPLDVLSKDHMVADLVAIIGSVDIVLGDTDR